MSILSTDFYAHLKNLALSGKMAGRSDYRDILTSDEIRLLPLLAAAYDIREKHHGKTVTVHIINNGQNGFCPEDCSYCAQAKTSSADIDGYPLKSDKEFLAEAKNAYKKGAFRYCMVFAGRGPSKGRTEKLAGLIREIKSRWPLEICVSAGLMDLEKTKILKEAGCDRINHNLNTSQKHYPKICTTHTYEDRIKTLRAARDAGIDLCSGIIIGMGEEINDIIDVALELRKNRVASIPVNFLIPIKGNALSEDPNLTPEFCLRVLCLFRFINPKAEIRIAAGREYHLRSMQPLALYPANSLFLDGYLNVKGNNRYRTLKMIRDAGFEIESEIPLEQLLKNESTTSSRPAQDRSFQAVMKDLDDLRPSRACQ